MGFLNILRRLKGRKDKELKILILGLDNAGKTTILKQLSSEDVNQVSPTVGFNVKFIHQTGFKLNVWDLGGQLNLRQYWRHYFENLDVLIFVVDAMDRERFSESQVELSELLQEPRLKHIPLLVYANKQDMPGSAPASEITTQMHLHRIKDRTWQIQACCAKTGEGVLEGMEWACHMASNK